MLQENRRVVGMYQGELVCAPVTTYCNVNTANFCEPSNPIKRTKEKYGMFCPCLPCLAIPTDNWKEARQGRLCP
jgi:hypothetical protein